MIAIPEGVTDPDEIDRLLEAEDARVLEQAAGRADRDDALMAAVPRNRPNPDAARSPKLIGSIEDCVAYSALPWWQRWPFRQRPAGYVCRRP